MKAIKWMNMSIVAVLYLGSIILMIMNSNSEEFNWVDVAQILSIPLLLLASVLFVAMYENNLLPISVEKLLDRIMKED